MSFSVQRTLARNLVLSTKIQSTSGIGGAPLPLAAMTRRQRFDVSGVLDRTPSRRSDIKYAGKDSPFATSSETYRWATSFNIKGELDDWMAGFLFCHALGQDIVSGSGPYVHALEYLIAFDSQAPMTSFFLQDTNDLTRLAQDMALSDLTITIPKSGSVTFEANFMGSGMVTELTTEDLTGFTLPVVPAATYFLAEEATTNFGPLGSLVSFDGRMESMVLKLQTGVSGMTAMGDGGYFAFMRQGIPKISWSATIAAQDTDDIETLIANDTAIGFNTTMAPSASVSLAISLPQVNLKATKMGTENDMTIWNIEADESGIQPDSDGNGPVAVTVTNSVAQYLAVDLTIPVY